MAYKVLVVDDSSFFRRRLTDILNKDPNITVIDAAINGREAVEKAIKLRPDVITMDIEMPILNGIEAVKQIMAKAPTSILMFSSLTHQGAKATLEALSAGALDFLPKKFSEIAKNTDEAGLLLRQRVIQIAQRKRKVTHTGSNSNAVNIASTAAPLKRKLSEKTVSLTTNKDQTTTANNLSGKKYKLLAIGTSTGGPVALQKILTQLPSTFPLPIILIQHMPAAFTKAFAERLNVLCKIKVKEAENDDILIPGCAYLAPGGQQMIVAGTENAPKLRVLADDSPRVTYKPSVDISFGSAAKVYNGDVLAIILTGMGADGREGSRMLKSKGATIWSQDEESCVVYGMPQAVTIAGISQLELPLENVASSIIREVKHG